MNSNFFHNILNVLIAIAGFGSAVLLAFGCTATGTGYDCTQAIISPELLGFAAGGLGVLKLVINTVRDGFRGLTNPQVQVSPSGQPGTVTQKQVETGRNK